MYKIFKITVLLAGDMVRVHYYKTKLGEYASNFRNNIEKFIEGIYPGIEYVILKTTNTGVSFLELKALCAHRLAQINRGTSSPGEIAMYRSDLSKLKDILDEVGNQSKVTKTEVDYKVGRLLHG